MLGQIMHSLEDEEMRALARLREARRRRRHIKHAHDHDLSLGQRVSDAVARTVGSWKFIIIQSIILVIWMVLNIVVVIEHWDPYPFILLNLVLSFQAAYTAPIIMMSQNRQNEIDRRAAQHDYDINLKAELEIELLHQKLDLIREKEIAELTGIIKAMQAQICGAESGSG